MTPDYTPAFGRRGAIRWTRDALLAVAGELLPQDREFGYAVLHDAAVTATGAVCYTPSLVLALLRHGCIERRREARDDRRRRYLYRVVVPSSPWSEEDVREARQIMRLEGVRT